MKDFLMVDFIIRLSLGIVGLLIATYGVVWCKVKSKRKRSRYERKDTGYVGN